MKAYSYIISLLNILVLIFSAYGAERGNVKELERTFPLNEATNLEDFAARQIGYLVGRYSDKANLTDYYNAQYTMDIGVGTPQQKFKVSPDTGSSDLWVYSSSCTLTCNSKSKYDASLSTTYKPESGNFALHYGSGTVWGHLATDEVHVTPHLVADSQLFGQVILTPTKFALWPIDGVLGLAFPSLSASGGNPVFETLIKQKKVSKPIFSIFLNRDLSSSNGGEVMFGGVDPSHINGPGLRAPLTKLEWFIFNLKMVCFGDGGCTNVVFRNGKAIADTGTSLIGGPADIVRKINTEILGGTRSSSGLYYVDCAKLPSLPPVTFILDNGSLTLHSKSYILRLGNKCLLGFQELAPMVNGPQWIFGDILLGEFYTAYDMGVGRESVTFYPAK